MSLLMAVAIGILTGLHAATWGSFKDTPFEGFRLRSFVRSIVLGAAGSALLSVTSWLDRTEAFVALVGVFYATERLCTEWWKSFLREQDQTVYAIPMRIAVGGRTIDSPRARYAVGLTVVVGLVLACWAAGALQPHGPAPLWQLVSVGGLGGWLTAVGGAWKDAPVEGFSPAKFVRSPVVASAWALALVPFTQSWVVLAVSAAGLSVATIETYKTFLTGGRPPGKFSGKPVLWSQHHVRERCRFLHSGLYVVLASALAGSAALTDRSAGQSVGQLLALLTMAVLATTVAVLVAFTPDHRSPPFAMLAPPDRSAARLTAARQEAGADADLRGTTS